LKVTILILLIIEQPSATNKNTQQHEASHGLSAIAELLLIHSDYIQYLTINSRYISVLFRTIYWGLSFIFNIGISTI